MTYVEGAATTSAWVGTDHSFWPVRASKAFKFPLQSPENTRSLAVTITPWGP